MSDKSRFRIVKDDETKQEDSFEDTPVAVCLLNAAIQAEKLNLKSVVIHLIDHHHVMNFSAVREKDIDSMLMFMEFQRDTLKNQRHTMITDKIVTE